jgi:hypothetical protein
MMSQAQAKHKQTQILYNEIELNTINTSSDKKSSTKQATTN